MCMCFTCVCVSPVLFFYLLSSILVVCSFVCFLNRERTKACGEVGKIWKEMREGKHWSEGIA